MASSSFAAAPTVLSPPHFQSTGKFTFCVPLASLPHPPPPPSRCSTVLPSSSSVKRFTESSRVSLLQARATSSEETTGGVDAGEFITDLKEKWDAVENKSTVLVYGGGAIVAVWLSSIIVGAINSVPLLPKIMELVGLGYSGWFVYRYLLFKSSRKELATDIEAWKKKIAGTAE